MHYLLRFSKGEHMLNKIDCFFFNLIGKEIGHASFFNQISLRQSTFLNKETMTKIVAPVPRHLKSHVNLQLETHDSASWNEC